ncbi:uncharacterized protein K460DRAFT_67261 [Cucurbitaria berberidis CBS 394.84]|uniref:Uncharacterized protein n=1 Tax=Cucurbitaria berberidis CBS 394.84 TaxID=1168544 RepID=A0A9P4GKK3_9PLEO|nr:uncharacterized protein K460DRAFT_67261 [Cucurbitaria berberidis CBS 394.84]KAF1848038.1 hypothetical protein K460DRAFT_67261 [Cucurbitaria berberidis CBS 394.84]
MEKWVRTAYHDHFCDWYRQPIGKVDLELLRTILHEQRPNETQGIDDGLKKLNLEICTHLCKDVERDAQGRFRDPSHAHALLANARTDLLNKTLRKKVVKELQEQGTLAHQEIKSTVSSTSIYPEAKADTLPAAHQETTSTVSSTPIYPQDKADILSPTHQVPGPTMENELQQWIHQLYHDKGFVNQGFIGWKSFAQLLTQKNPDREKEIKKTLQE